MRLNAFIRLFTMHFIQNLKLYKKFHLYYPHFCYHRFIYTLTGEWPDELTKDIKFEIENHWHPKLQHTKDELSKRDKFYVLSMFPYPSGQLHMGHVRVYTISDAVARFHRMRGMNVIHPMGWDAFGLPAENAAIERGEQPKSWTYCNIANMKQQLLQLGCSFDWEREFSTCDPKYYKWTQYLFLKMFEQNLAYQKEASVNWDPVDETVLADEQVDENQCSWRSGAKVEKKWLKQWFLRATQFSKSLYDGLNDPVLENWKDITKIQKHWIGECNGVSFEFKLRDSYDSHLEESLSIWMDKPEFVFGGTFIVLSPEDDLLRKVAYNFEDTQDVYKLNIMAVHPFTRNNIPIFVCRQFSRFPEGRTSYLGTPGEILEDQEFSNKNGLQVIKLLLESVEGSEKVLSNSGQFTGLSLVEAREQICQTAKVEGFGSEEISSKHRDWLISRQRYWGTPIPIIYCTKCKVVPVPYEDLPVLLPEIDSMSGKGSPLKKMREWSEVICPKCKGPATRETDTLDTFVDSSWYYLRFLDPGNTEVPFDKSIVDRDMPVDIYIGGKEHAELHLYYARFVSHFFHMIGLCSHKEPFKRLLVQGMVKGQSFKTKDGGKYLRKDQVENIGGKYVEKVTGAAVDIQWEKMSKSHYNGIDPKQVIEEYGVDTTRLLMLANVTPTSDRNWPASTFPGVLNWQRRLWLTVSEFIQLRNGTYLKQVPNVPPELMEECEAYMFDARNSCVSGVTDKFHRTFQLSVGISFLQGLTRDLRGLPLAVIRDGAQYERALAVQIIMLAPIVPHFASELWAGFTSTGTKQASPDFHLDKDVLSQDWPQVDMNYELDIVVKINGEIVHMIKVPRHQLDTLTKVEVLDRVEKDGRAREILDDWNPRRIHVTVIPSFGVEVDFIIPKFKNIPPYVKPKPKKPGLN